MSDAQICFVDVDRGSNIAECKTWKFERSLEGISEVMQKTETRAGKQGGFGLCCLFDIAA